MRKLILGSTLVFLSSCATGVISDGMQPDGSYRILTGGAALATRQQAKEEAYRHAEGLCPNGYDKKSEMYGNVGLKPRYQLIVKCQ